MPLPADGLRLAIFTAEPGTTSADALHLLSSWTATAYHDEARPTEHTLIVPAGRDHADDHEKGEHQSRTCDDDHGAGIVEGLPAATNDASEPNATPTTGTITSIASA
jgi:hypothetical protein